MKTAQDQRGTEKTSLTEALQSSFEKAGLPATESLREGCKELAKQLGHHATTHFLIGLFAAPRCLARAYPMMCPSKEDLLAVFDQYLSAMQASRERHMHMPPEVVEFYAENTARNAKLEAIARDIRSQLETWEYSPSAPESLVRAARTWMDVSGHGWSDAEWDAYELPEAPEPSAKP
ncbi:hypothetical protein [Polyangium sp. 6x1]|uniref:hypothetical protein n=1 Tax=Polyangium sp. 6x1 TaxID=3042689 RepID=UPI002482603C|nr:hypothetical protein [Polyangium sp. 6x1]MDI1451397.1 hypothetical protein [Polyangium sp. 6x1]